MEGEGESVEEREETVSDNKDMVDCVKKTVGDVL
jgi:hypothetical protein